jgi:hypothetical protein
MPQYNVFRDGNTWYFSTSSVPRSEGYDTKDEAQFHAEKAVVDALKAERKARQEMKKEQKEIQPEES